MKILSLRLPEDAYRDLLDRSDETGIPPAVLARSYVLAQLRAGRQHRPEAAQVAGQKAISETGKSPATTGRDPNTARSKGKKRKGGRR